MEVSQSRGSTVPICLFSSSEDLSDKVYIYLNLLYYNVCFKNAYLFVKCYKCDYDAFLIVNLTGTAGLEVHLLGSTITKNIHMCHLNCNLGVGRRETLVMKLFELQVKYFCRDMILIG